MSEYTNPEYCPDCGQEANVGFRDQTFCKPCAIKNMTWNEHNLKGYEQRMLAFLNLNSDQKE